MRVTWVVPCRYVEVNGNLATIVGAGIDRVWVPYLPVPEPLRFLCAVRIAGALDELHEGEHQLVSRIYDPAMGLVSELSMPFALTGAPQEPGIEPALILPVGLIIQPMVEGQHTIEIAVDGRGASVPLTVRLGAPS